MRLCTNSDNTQTKQEALQIYYLTKTQNSSTWQTTATATPLLEPQVEVNKLFLCSYKSSKQGGKTMPLPTMPSKSLTTECVA
jgi:hypothetical protein